MMQDKRNGIKDGDFVVVKQDYAFEVPVIAHYGQVVDFDGCEMKINFDRRFTHDGFKWVKCIMYEVI